MKSRDPHDVLGVDRGASQATIKAAWRRLARENHPDLNGADSASARSATRRMVLINAAYEALRDGLGSGPRRRRDGPDGAGTGDDDSSSRNGFGPGRRPSGPPRPRPGRPVTGRVDTTDTFRVRNRTTTGPAPRGTYPPGQPPPRPAGRDREPPRASDPTGPLRRARLRSFQVPERPALSAAAAIEMTFGKFRGHTLGDIAAFEPSYIDWIASTITRDASLVAAARVIRDDLDRRGVVRRKRETERQKRDRERQRREWTRIFGGD